MCLIAFAHESHSDYRLVVAANRDEFYDRPSEGAGFWKDHPRLLAGRDLRGGGTWLGVTLDGRVAAVTNYRGAETHRSEALSRGALVREFLVDAVAPETYLERLRPTADRYNGFSLIVGDRSGLWFCSNRDGEPRPIHPGVHALSNHLLDTAWPKVERARRGVAEALDYRGGELTERLFALLADRCVAGDVELPDTGVGPERERQLSPIFVRLPGYGTRCSTVLLVGRDGGVELSERSFDPAGELQGTANYEFPLDRRR